MGDPHPVCAQEELLPEDKHPLVATTPEICLETLSEESEDPSIKVTLLHKPREKSPYATFKSQSAPLFSSTYLT